jgi:hypothetical protein
MALPNWYVDELKTEIARLNYILIRLESGTGGKTLGRFDPESTPAAVCRLSRSIAELQSIVDERNA